MFMLRREINTNIQFTVDKAETKVRLKIKLLFVHDYAYYYGECYFLSKQKFNVFKFEVNMQIEAFQIV